MSPNAVRIDGQTAYVTVACKSRGFVGEAMVDVADLERVRHCRWYAKWDAKSRAYYVWTGVGFTDVDGRRKTVTAPLHRVVMKLLSPLKVDHRNHNTLDNRRANLRLVTHAENMQNRKGARKQSSSGVRGVSWYPRTGKWKVGLKVHGRQIHLGYYDSLAEAEAAAIVGRQAHMTHSRECEQTGTHLQL